MVIQVVRRRYELPLAVHILILRDILDVCDRGSGAALVVIPARERPRSRYAVFVGRIRRGQWIFDRLIRHVLDTRHRSRSLIRLRLIRILRRYDVIIQVVGGGYELPLAVHILVLRDVLDIRDRIAFAVLVVVPAAEGPGSRYAVFVHGIRRGQRVFDILVCVVCNTSYLFRSILRLRLIRVLRRYDVVRQLVGIRNELPLTIHRLILGHGLGINRLAVKVLVVVPALKGPGSRHAVFFSIGRRQAVRDILYCIIRNVGDLSRRCVRLICGRLIADYHIGQCVLRLRVFYCDSHGSVRYIAAAHDPPCRVTDIMPCRRLSLQEVILFFQKARPACFSVIARGLNIL